MLACDGCDVCTMHMADWFQPACMLQAVHIPFCYSWYMPHYYWCYIGTWLYY